MQLNRPVPRAEVRRKGTIIFQPDCDIDVALPAHGDGGNRVTHVSRRNVFGEAALVKHGASKPSPLAARPTSMSHRYGRAALVCSEPEFRLRTPVADPKCRTAGRQVHASITARVSRHPLGTRRAALRPPSRAGGSLAI